MEECFLLLILINVGVNKLVAVHRGFHTYEKTSFRHHPLWEIPIELKRRMPELPLITDPSHISGKRSYISEISQRALNLGFDGLMIESHINPDEALSDSKQQLTPKRLSEILDTLKYRITDASNSEHSNKLESLRDAIDEIDEQLLLTLSRRMKLINEIGVYKEKHNISILQIRRWNNILESRLKVGEDIGLRQEFLVKMLKLVHQESVSLQQNILNL